MDDAAVWPQATKYGRLIKRTEMKRLKDIPLSRPAATAHSPYRKPREGGRLDRMRAFAARQEAVLILFLGGYSQPQIEKDMVLPPTSIENMRHDPEFRARMDAAKEFAKSNTQGYGAALNPLAMATVEDTITGKNKSPLKFEAAQKHLKGTGVYFEKSVTEVRGLIGVYNADDLARSLREAKKRLLEGGN